MTHSFRTSHVALCPRAYSLFTVTARQYKAFVALMEAPLAENPALKCLPAKQAPWDK